MAIMKISRPKPQGPHAEVAQLASDMLETASAVHKLHLRITGGGSYAAHKALNELYDALPGHVDELVEQYQGAAETLLTYPEAKTCQLNSVQDALGHIRMLYVQVTELQAMMPYSEIVNILDETKSTLNATKYKLMFLS